MKYRPVIPYKTSENTYVFTVWAPKAVKMHLVLQDGRKSVPMDSDDSGYWSVSMDHIETGSRYKYQIDEKECLPDPASLSQPEGVHGASEIVDLEQFEWGDGAWLNISLSDMILYELHTGTFSPEGNFAGIRSKLDYLKDLGINAIEIMPVAQFSGTRNWGYDGVYPFAVHNSYGGAKELMMLVDACHNKGLAVILDVVYNHIGPEGNYVGNFGHYFSGNYSTPWGRPINFDGPYSDGVRNFFIQNALMWCRDFHMDGLRLDAVHAIYDFSAKHILQELAENLNRLSVQTKKPYYLIAESHLNDIRYTSPVERGGYGLRAQWSDDFHHALHALLTGERMGYYADFGRPSQLAKAIQDAFVFEGQYSVFRKKSYGSRTQQNPGEQFVIFSQNHDQVGNRIRGDRLISLVGTEKAKLAAGALFIAPNIPMLFMGEEFAEQNPFYYFVSHLDTRLNNIVRKSRNKEFRAFFGNSDGATEPDSITTFKRSKLSWHIEEKPDRRLMYDFYKTLIRIRKNNPVLKDPNKDRISVSHYDKHFMIKRWKENKQVMALLNFDDFSQTVSMPPDIQPMVKILDSAEKKWNGKGETAPECIISGHSFNIPALSMVIYSNDLS